MDLRQLMDPKLMALAVAVILAVAILGVLGRSTSGQWESIYASDHAAAVAEAKALVAPGRKIFLQNIDTNDWSEISS
jgi:hypothetical protein